MPKGEDDAGLPAQVKCPMCGNNMSQMGIKDRTTTDLTMSTLNYSVSDKIKKEGKKKHFVRTAVFVCDKCRNIQSFLLTDSKVTGRKKNLPIS
jgi:DNA-directed RNA polymerase subunit M/transcription elongation factor TFIIS